MKHHFRLECPMKCQWCGVPYIDFTIEEDNCLGDPILIREEIWYNLKNDQLVLLLPAEDPFLYLAESINGRFLIQANFYKTLHEDPEAIYICDL